MTNSLHYTRFRGDLASDSSTSCSAAPLRHRNAFSQVLARRSKSCCCRRSSPSRFKSLHACIQRGSFYPSLRRNAFRTLRCFSRSVLQPKRSPYVEWSPVRSSSDGSSFSGLFTRVEMGPHRHTGYVIKRSCGLGSKPEPGVIARGTMPISQACDHGLGCSPGGSSKFLHSVGSGYRRSCLPAERTDSVAAAIPRSTQASSKSKASWARGWISSRSGVLSGLVPLKLSKWFPFWISYRR